MRDFKLTLFLLALLFISCESNRMQTVTIELAGTPFSIEVATSLEEQTKGLMKRKSLDPNSGMIFTYDYDKKMSFWMKNTLIPLSIAYISADGVVKEIYDMEPLDLVPVVSKHSVRYALEVNQGRFSELGIVTGMKLFDPGQTFKKMQ